MADLIDRDALMKKICGNECGCVCDEECENALCNFYDYIMDAPAVNRWIPCSERLPGEAGEYLVCGKWSGEKSKTWVCRFVIFGNIGGFINSAKNPPVSFWRPMPELPEDEEKW